jgi:hypothetical protein
MKLRSPAGTKILGALALLLVAALGWLLVVGPETTALAEVRTQIAEAETQNDALRQQLTVLKEQQEQLPQTRAASDALTARIPATADQPGLFAAVAEAVADAGIPAEDLTALTPTPPVIGTGDETAGVQLPTEGAPANVATQTVTVSVEATYAETQQLLDNLEQMPRAYLVTSLTVAAAEGSGQFSTTIAGNMFVMPLAEELDSPAAEPASDGS